MREETPQAPRAPSEAPGSSLSVIVVSCNSPSVLPLCLEALSEEPEAAEIIVADCSDRDPTPDLSPRFPQVRFLHYAEKRTLPELRWGALERTGGQFIGCLEARMVPAPDWRRRMLLAHRADPDAAAVGGPVELDARSSAFETALYFCEYGAFAPPLESARVTALTGANICYRRAALEENRDILDRGLWETLLFERWAAQGRPVRIAGALVTFHNTMRPATAFAQRFHYGRAYASERTVFGRGSRRFLFAAFTPLLPLLLSWRNARSAIRKSPAAALARCLPWILLLNTLWSAGELTGYLFGPSRRPRIY